MVASQRNCLKHRLSIHVDLGFIPIWVLGSHEEKLNLSEPWCTLNGDNHTCLLMAVGNQWDSVCRTLRLMCGTAGLVRSDNYSWEGVSWGEPGSSIIQCGDVERMWGVGSWWQEYCD